MNKYPFGKTEAEHNAFCDSIKDNKGSYETFFKMVDKAVERKKEIRKCLDCGVELTEKVSSELKSNWCDRCYYFD